MKRRISEWPAVRVNVNPHTLARIEAQAERRALSVSAVIRRPSIGRIALRPS